jgi:3-oxoacyl-[acyl-carrier protein] reductase
LDALQLLVNDAGISIDGLILRYEAALRPVMKQRGGSIVNLTSVVGEQGNAEVLRVNGGLYM